MGNNDPNQSPIEQPAERPASEQVLCPNCNGGNQPGSVNCTWCGRPMGVTDTTDATPAASLVATPSAAVYSPDPSGTQQEYQPQAQPYQSQATDYTRPAQPGYTAAPQYPQPAPVVTASPAKSGSGRRIALIVGGVLLGLLLLCGILFGSLFAGVMGLTQPAVDVGDKFMAALRDGNYDRAFELSTPSLQQEVGDAETLRGALQSKQPTKWSFTSRNIQNELATLKGTTTYPNNEPGEVEMELRKVGNDWLVSFINLK